MWRRLRQCSLGMRWHISVMTDIQLVKVSLTEKKQTYCPPPKKEIPDRNPGAEHPNVTG